MPILGLLFLFLFSFNLLEIAYRLPFACISASFYFYFLEAPGSKCQRMALSQYFRFLSERKTDVAKDKSKLYLTHPISETSKATVDKERVLEPGELTL